MQQVPSQMQASGLPAEEKLGYALVAMSAIVWSFGGAIGRYVDHLDPWTAVFWRSFWAAIFLLGFMLWRDGRRGTLALFAGMGLPGLAVAFCFATASTSFVVALQYTTVANIVLIMAGVPLFAALIGRIAFREQLRLPTWLAIAGVIAGVGVMVSDSVAGRVSPIGDGLALTIAIVFAIATVITRRYAHVRMTPATCLGTMIAAVFAATQIGAFAVNGTEMGWLVAFGAFNLGLGLAFFAYGVRLVPAAYAALIGTLEPVLGPLWAWLLHGEAASPRTLLGGGIVVVALVAHLLFELDRHRRSAASRASP